MRIITWISFVSLAITLSSCSTLSVKQEPTTQQKPSMSWNSRSEQLAQIKTWNLKGLIALRTPKDSWSANWQWQQAPGNYKILLLGPLGSNSFTLTGSAGNVSLATSDGKNFSAKSAEQLLAEQVGWKFPVSSLHYWIRGLPVPGIPATTQFDNSNHLTQLTQQGWTIQYLGYTPQNNIDLPSKIVLNSSQLDIKIVIKQWQL